MKAPAVFLSLLLSIAVIAIAFVEYNQYSEINKVASEQELLSKELLRLKQELAESWTRHHEDSQESWPKYHDATGKLLHKSQNRVVVDEDEIPGFMRAMIMSYEVENPEQLSGLEEGDSLEIKLKETETKLTVVEIKKR